MKLTDIFISANITLPQKIKHIFWDHTCLVFSGEEWCLNISAPWTLKKETGEKLSNANCIIANSLNELLGSHLNLISKEKDCLFFYFENSVVLAVFDEERGEVYFGRN